MAPLISGIPLISGMFWRRRTIGSTTSTTKSRICAAAEASGSRRVVAVGAPVGKNISMSPATERHSPNLTGKFCESSSVDRSSQDGTSPHASGYTAHTSTSNAKCTTRSPPQEPSLLVYKPSDTAIESDADAEARKRVESMLKKNREEKKREQKESF